jgi:hypothetical protein
MERGSEGDLQENGGQSSLGMNTGQEGPVSLARRTYKLYRERFEEYFPFLLGVTVVGCVLCVALDHASTTLKGVALPQNVFDQPPPFFYLRRRLLGWLFGCSEILVGWVVMTLAFACIAAKVLGNAKGMQKVPVSQAFRSAMSRSSLLALAAFLGALATILFWSFVLPFLLRPLALLLILGHLGYDIYLISNFLARGLILVIFGTLLARMATAIPGVLDEPSRSLRDTLSSCLRYTKGHQLFMTLGLGASAACGFLVYFVAGSVLEAACSRGDFSLTACSWFLALLAALIIALLAGPAFIYLSLLYLEGSATERASLAALAR